MKKTQEPDKRWKPKNGEEYFYVDSNHTFSMLVPRIEKRVWDDNIPIHSLRWEIGNCFKRKKKAQEVALKIRKAFLDC